MKNITVIGGFAINDTPLNFLNDLATIDYIDINQFPATYGLEDMSKTVSKSLAFNNNILIAYSMGGLIAIYMVYRNPDIFNQVILLNSSPCFMENNNWYGIAETSFKKLQKKLELSNIDEFYKYFITLIAYPDKLPTTQYEVFKSNTSKEQLNNLLNILYETDLRNKLASIKEKFIFINANNDILVKNNEFDRNNYWLNNCSHLNIDNSKELIFKILSSLACCSQLSFLQTADAINTLLPSPEISTAKITNSGHANEKLIQSNFNKAAITYLKNKNIQIAGAEKIESYLLNNSLQQELTLDLGSGPGTFKNIPKTVLYDLSLNMLKISKNSAKINGNAANLPFCNESFFVIASNLMLQWLEDKNQTFREVFRTLKDNGVFIYTTLINESLWQLSQAFSHIDDKLHTLNFITENEYSKLAINHGFKVIHKSTWEDTLIFNDIYNLLMHFKLTGTNLPKSNCNSGLGGRKNIESLKEVYPKVNSHYPISYKHLLMVLQK